MFVPALFVLLFCSSITAGLELGDLMTFPSRIFSPEAINLSSYHLVVGQIVSVTCSLPSEKYEEGFRSRDISFRHGATEACLPLNNVTLIDRLTAMLTFPVTIESDGSYQCLDRPNCQGELFGSSEKLYVDYRPKPVVNFSCKTFYDGKDFEVTCQWDDPISYKYPDVYVNYCFREFVLESSDLEYCNDTKSDNSLTIKSNSLPIASYVINITVMNSKVPTVSASQMSSYDAFSHIKLDRVSSFIVTPSPRCFSFKWTSLFCRNHRCIYRIYVSTSSSNLEGREVLSNSLTRSSFKKCNFSANTQYEFCVQVHPTGLLNGPWNNPVCRKGTTPITAPSESPKITPGSYVYLDDNPCHESDMRKITLFWKALDETKQNGALDGYHITINEKTLTVSNDSFSKTLELACAKEYMIDISAFNSNGSSPMPSRLPLEPFPHQLKVSDDIKKSFAANFSGDKVSASWVESTARNYSKFIYWCKGASGSHECEEELAWSEVQNQQQMMVLPIESQKASMYLYGISLQNTFSSSSSGIFWTSCLFQDNAKVNMPDNFDLGTSDGVVIVMWHNEDCSYRRNYRIIRHQVKWCLNAKCEDRFVEYPKRSFTIPEVLPGHTYNVTMRAITQNKESDFLPWKSITPKVQDESEYYGITFIAVSLAIIVIIILIVAFGVYRWRGRLVHKFFEENGDDLMKLPDYLDYIPAEKPKENLYNDNPRTPNEKTNSQDNTSGETSNNGTSASSDEYSSSPKQPSTPSSSSGRSYSSDYDMTSGAQLLPKAKGKKKKKQPNNSGVRLTTFKTQSGSACNGTCNEVCSSNGSIPDAYSKVKVCDQYLKNNCLNSYPAVHMNGFVPTSVLHEDNQICFINGSPHIETFGPNRADNNTIVSADHNSSESCNNMSSTSGEETSTKDNSVPQTTMVKTPSNEDRSDRLPNKEIHNNTSQPTTAILPVSSSGTIHQDQQNSLGVDATQASTTFSHNADHSDYVKTVTSIDPQSDMGINRNGNHRQFVTRTPTTPTTFLGSEHDNRTQKSNGNPEYITTAPSYTNENGSKVETGGSANMRIPSQNIEHFETPVHAIEYVRTCGRNNDEYIREIPTRNTECTGQMCDKANEIMVAPFFNKTKPDVIPSADNGNEYVRRSYTCDTDDSELLIKTPTSSTDTEHLGVPINCDVYVRLPRNDNEHEGKMDSSHSNCVETQSSDNDIHDAGSWPRHHDNSVEGIPPNDNEYVRQSGVYDEDRGRMPIDEIGTEHPNEMLCHEEDYRSNLSTDENESENVGEVSDDTAYVDSFPNNASTSSHDEVIHMTPSGSVVV